MSERRQNFWVGVFVVLAFVGIGWMLIVFRDLPVRVNRHGANIVTVYFPMATGVEANTMVKFLGYSVGRVVAIDPPALIRVEELQSQESFQVRMELAIDPKYQIPAGIIPKVQQKGLGSSHLEFVLPAESDSTILLADGDVLIGRVGTGNDFISESMQASLDDLIASMTRLGDALQSQLVSVSPDQVDSGEQATAIRPNLTTAIMRLDRSLKHLNTILGDTANQENIRKTLSGMAMLTDDLQVVVEQANLLMQDGRALAQQAGGTLTRVEGSVEQLADTYDQVGLQIQEASASLIDGLAQFKELAAKLSDGEGTAGRILNDPRLYESLTDAAETLSLSLTEFKNLMAELNEHGVLGFKGNKKKR